MKNAEKKDIIKTAIWHQGKQPNRTRKDRKGIRDYTAKTKCRKFETNIPSKGILGSQSQFPHSCVCERIIYFQAGSAFSSGGNMWTDPGTI
jgi:hypothetical protein